MSTKLTNRTIGILKPAEKPYEVRDTDIKGFLLRVQPSGKMTFYISYTNAAGKKQRYRIGSHGTITAAKAREVAEDKAAEVAKGKDVQHHHKQARIETEQNKAKTLRAFLDNKYGSWIKAQRKSGEQTVAMIETQFAHLMEQPLDNITQWDIEKWRRDRLNAKIKPSTINRNVTSIKALLSKAVEWDIIHRHPLAKVRPLKLDNHGVVRYLDGEEEKSLREALISREEEIRRARSSANVWRKERGYKPLPEIPANTFADHLQSMVLLSLNTGLRRSEVFNLHWEDITFSNSSLRVKGAFSKTGHTRYIPLNKEAEETLKKWRGATLKPQGLVFPSEAGKPFNNANKAWRGVLKDADIKKFRWHDMRHHFASKLVMAGVDLNTVRELLGHSTLDMTLRYAHLAPEHKAEAVARLNNVTS